MTNISLLLSLLLLAVSCRANPLFGMLVENPKNEPATNDYLLPDNAVPLEYDITLKPILKEENFVFTGSSKIIVKVLKATNTLTLHAKNLKVVEGVTIQADREEPIKGKSKLDTEKEFLIITVDKPLAVKQYTLFLEYSGELNDKLRGFYRSSYLDKDNKRRWLATTHFEPTGARLAFPCWDEPALKAKFTITLEHPLNYVALSNMPVDAVTNKTDIAITKFKQTKLMSTYLVAFVVSDYLNKENEDKTFRVWTKPHAVDQTKFALEIGQKELTALDEYTGIKYSTHMPKMDQISIPDFAAGAMENWGLVTYRESALLYTENVTSTMNKQRIAAVISHEFAHQWFGNLVSPKWWNYVWLNEGFATYFEHIITDKVEPNWRMLEQFVVASLQGVAFVQDAKDTALPITRDVKSPSEISRMFDNIVYQKAGSVIRMMSQIVSEKVFQDGLKRYLNALKYNSAENADLFKHLQEAIDAAKIKDLDIAKIMENWVTKAGYPVITVARNEKDLKVSQERFSFTDSGEENKWWIPLHYATEENPDFVNITTDDWLNPKDESVKITGVNQDKWYLFNKNQTGYYRVNYDDKNWDLLAKFLKTKDYQKIPPVNRAQLIDDALNLARAGKLNYPVAFTLVSFLAEESDYVPWSAAWRGFAFLNNMLDNSESYNAFQIFMNHIMKKLVKTVKFEANEKDDHITKLARVNTLYWACKTGLAECMVYSQSKLRAWLEDSKKNPLDVDLKSNIICAGLRHAEKETWDKALKKYEETTDSEEKTALLAGLGCTKNVKILQDYLTLALAEKSKIEDFTTAFHSVVSNSAMGTDVALNMLTDHYKNFTAIDKDGNVPSYVQKVGEYITTQDQYFKLGLLISKKGLEAKISTDTMKTAVQNVQWGNLYRGEVGNWLKKQDFKHNSATTASLTALFFILPILLTLF